MTVGWETETLVCCILASRISYIFINHILFKAPMQNANQMSAWLHINIIYYFNNYAKHRQAHQLSSKPEQSDRWIEFAYCAVCLQPCSQVR